MDTIEEVKTIEEIKTINVMAPENEKLWGMFAHLGGFAGTLFAFAQIVVPLVIWLVHKDKSTFVAEHAKESLNFQLTLLIVYFIGGILSFILIGIPILIAAFIISIVFGVIGSVKAYQGEQFKYPFMTIRFFK